MADMKKVYDDFTIINLYDLRHELQIWTEELIFFSLDWSVTENQFFLVVKEKKIDILASFLFWFEMTTKLRLIFGFTSQADQMSMVKFIYSGEATKSCEISTLLLSVCTVDKSKMEISQNFVAFLEYVNFKW